MDAARVAQQSTCLNGGDFVRRLQLSNNAIHKYARTMAVCQRVFFFFRLCGKVIQHVSNPRRENAWTHLHLSPPCFLHLDNSKTFILAKCRKTNFPRIKYILQQAGNWIKLWEVPSQHHFTAVYSNRLLRWIQSKTGTNLLVQSPRSSQAPEAKRVCQAPNTANIVYSGTKKYFSTNKMHCQSVSPSFF